MIRAVIDTNVLFSGLTNGDVASDLIVQAWHGLLFQPYVSTALMLEYRDVLSRKLSPMGWKRTEAALSSLLQQSVAVPIYYTWRPVSSDYSDDLVIDCAMNANAMIVTPNKRDFRMAKQKLGLQVLSAAEFVGLLSEI